MALSKEEKIRLEIFNWLALFSKSELTQLRKFLDSPFFNNTLEIVKIYERLSEEFKKSKDDTWNAQKLADSLYTKKEQPGARLHQLYEHLLKLKDLIGQFTAHIELKENAVTRLQVTVTALSHYANKELFETTCDEYESLLNPDLADADTYGEFAWLYRERHSFQTAERFVPNAANLLAANTYLDRHYLALKLRHVAESLIASRIFQDGSKESTLAPTVKQIAMTYYDTDSLIHIYIDAIAFLQEEEVLQEEIIQFENFYFTNLKYLSEKENQGIIKMVIHLYFHSMLHNRHPLPIRIVEWFRVALGEHERSSRNFFLLNGVLPDEAFLNIASFSATNHAFDFAHDFIDRYTPLLQKDRQENAACLARCYVWLHEEKYDEVHQLLKPEEVTNPDDYYPLNGKIINKYEALIRSEFRYAIRARTVLIRVYLMRYLHDWSYGEHFLYAKDAFRKYLDYDALKLDEHRKNSYHNFLAILGEVYHHLQQHKLSDGDRAKLLAKAEATQPMVCQQWLLDVIENKMPWQKVK